MNIPLIYYTPYLGPVLGVGLGSIVRCLYHRSLMNYNSTHHLGCFSKISSYCESIRFKSNSLKGFFAVILISEIFPFALSIIEQVGMALRTESFANSLLQGGVFFAKVCSYSLSHTIPITLVGIGLIFVVKVVIEKGRRAPIDPSGHVMTACMNAALRCHSLQFISKLGYFSYTYVAFTGIMTVAEMIWVYDTTVNHHSVVDSVSGLALGILSMQAYNIVRVAGASLLQSSNIQIYLPKSIF